MQLLSKIGNVVNEIDLGEVDVGQTKEYSFQLFNENRSTVENLAAKISIIIPKDDDGSEMKITEEAFKAEEESLKVTHLPSQLNKKEKALFKFTWTPTIRIKRGLRAKVSVTGKEIFRP